MTPTIVEKPAFIVVGLKHNGAPGNEEIPKMWEQFAPRMDAIPHRIHPTECFGVCANFDHAANTFDYLAAVAVDRTTDVPADMEPFEIPAQTYAVFPCTLPTLMQTIDYIYQEWLPGADYERTEGPEFELYGPDFRPGDGEFGMSLYIPVQKVGS